MRLHTALSRLTLASAARRQTERNSANPDDQQRNDRQLLPPKAGRLHAMLGRLSTDLSGHPCSVMELERGVPLRLLLLAVTGLDPRQYNPENDRQAK